MSPELELLSQRALSAVLNGIYQGLLLTLVLATGLRLAPRLNAATRFSIRFAALLIIAALPLAHLASAWISSAPGEAPTAGKPSVLMAAKDPSRAPDLIAFEPARDDLGHSPPNAAAILSAILERRAPNPPWPRSGTGNSNPPNPPGARSRLKARFRHPPARPRMRPAWRME
jgi:hypothetical protein